MSARAWAAALALCSACAHGIPEPWVPAGGALFDAPVKSLVELRYRGVVRQTSDLSCGAAALATLLQHFFEDEVSEREVIAEIVERGSGDSREHIEQSGFSMLELKRFGEHRGYVSDGYQLAPNTLERVNHPFIALTEVRGYKHFVVVRGIVDGTVYVADPAYGNRKLSLGQFEKEWSNNRILVFARPDTIEYFRTHREMPALVTAQAQRFVREGGVPAARARDVEVLVHGRSGPQPPPPGGFR